MPEMTTVTSPAARVRVSVLVPAVHVAAVIVCPKVAASDAAMPFARLVSLKLPQFMSAVGLFYPPL